MNNVHMILWPRLAGGHLLFAIRQDDHDFTLIKHPLATTETYPAAYVSASELKECIDFHIRVGCQLHMDRNRLGMFLLIAPGKSVADGIEAIMFFESLIKTP